MTHDLIVIGAGPAGASAAIAAAGLGLRTVVLDEQHAAGGQVWRAPSKTDAPEDDGARLRRRLHESGATWRSVVASGWRSVASRCRHSVLMARRTIARRR
jgi:thioredoxin reductase